MLNNEKREQFEGYVRKDLYKKFITCEVDKPPVSGYYIIIMNTGFTSLHL